MKLSQTLAWLCELPRGHFTVGWVLRRGWPGFANVVLLPKQLEVRRAALHRVRGQLVKQRTAAVNRLRGLLAEFGIVVAQVRRPLMAALPGILEDAENGIPPLMRVATDEQREWLAELDERIQRSTKRLELLAKQTAPCRTLTE